MTAEGTGEDRRARPHVVIVGGGIAGLAAAYFLRGEPVQVTVLEGAARPGGKLAVSDIAGVALDEGAEALLVRRPEGTGLIKDVGLGGQLVTPGTTSSAIWTRGALRPLPQRQFMGVPADLPDLARSGVLTERGTARARRDLELPATPRDGDTPVAAYVGARFGRELVERLVDPLLGGVYAGRSEDLSFEATLGPLAAAARTHRSLADAAATLLPAPPERDGTPTPAQAAASVHHAGRRPRHAARRRGAGLGSGHPDPYDGPRTGPHRDGLAAHSRIGRGAGGDHRGCRAAGPARPAGQPPAGRRARDVRGRRRARRHRVREHGDRDPRLPAFAPPRDTGCRGRGNGTERVPRAGRRRTPGEGRYVLDREVAARRRPAGLAGSAEPVDLIRCSIGRIGEEGLLQRDDRELAALAAADLADEAGAQGAPLDARVTRWGGALPQYTVGHLDRVAAIRAGVAAQPGLAVCGAAYDGIGIPACIATARTAAGAIMDYLRARTVS